VHDEPAERGDPARLVQATLAWAATIPMVRQTAPGCGETLHGAAGGIVAGALVHQGSVYHAVVMAAQ
jgi:hypothetical protein